MPRWLLYVCRFLCSTTGCDIADDSVMSKYHPKIKKLCSKTVSEWIQYCRQFSNNFAHAKCAAKEKINHKKIINYLNLKFRWPDKMTGIARVCYAKNFHYVNVMLSFTFTRLKCMNIGLNWIGLASASHLCSTDRNVQMYSNLLINSLILFATERKHRKNERENE